MALKLPEAKVLPAVVAAVRDDSPIVREAAAEVLPLFGAAVVPALLDLLKDKDADLRYRAAWILGMIGPPAKDAVRALIDRFKDSDARVRRGRRRPWAVSVRRRKRPFPP